MAGDAIGENILSQILPNGFLPKLPFLSSDYCKFWYGFMRQNLPIAAF